MNNHGNYPSDPIVASTATPPAVDGASEEVSRDMAGEDRFSDETPTGGTEENYIVSENFRATDSPTLPPQVDLHNGDIPVGPVEPIELVKPVEPVEQDSGDYRPQLDEDGEKIFEFKTKEELERWSDQMRERDHMINDQISNKNVETSYGEEEDDYDDEDDKMEDKEDKKYDGVLDKDEEKEEAAEQEAAEQEETKQEEEKDGEEEERKEGEYYDNGQEAQQEDEGEGERLEESSGIGDDEEEHHMTSPDHEQHQQEYLPSDVAEGSSDEEDHEVFEKIAEELAAAAMVAGDEQPTEWEDLVGQSSDAVPVTTVTDNLGINPTSILDRATVTSVVLETVGSNQMPDDKQTEGDDIGAGQPPPPHAYDNEENDETGKEQSQSSITDKTEEMKHLDTNELPEQYNLNGEASENQEKYEQSNLNISETSESQEKYKKDGEILEKEEISNDEIKSFLNLESKLEQQEEHKEGDSGDVRHDERYDEVHDGILVVEEEAKKDEDVQQAGDNSAEQRGYNYSKKDVKGKNLEEQYLEQKDEAAASGEQRYVENKREGGHEDVEGEKKEEESDKPNEEQPPKPSRPFHQASVADHPPSVTEESTSTLVAMTTQDIPVPIPSPLVDTSASVTTDDRGTHEDGELKSEETVEVVHKSTDTATAAATSDNQLRNINSRQSEDVFMSGSVCMCVCVYVCVSVCVY